jgi:16S rRNA (guanine(966)-N(2))-methyltransferase RsmD
VKRYLKLTGGSFMGRRLYVPDIGVRPATNLVREAIFSTLYSFFEKGVQGLRVLDLFAGTGSLGLESISRGARAVTFVDKNIESVKSIRKNMEILQYEGKVIRSDVVQFLRRNRKLEFDLVFIDPPYKYEKTPLVLEELQQSLVGERRVLYIHERAYRRELPDFGDAVHFYKRKKYGQTEILYFGFQD